MLFQNIVNARDLGGIRIGDRVVRKGRLLRTAHLHDASDEDVRLLSEHYNLKRIFDFRTYPEASMQPDRPVPGAEYLLLPTLDISAEKETGEAIPDEMWLDLSKHIVRLSFTKFFQERARDLYPSLILSEFSQLQYATFRNLILETEEGAVLWHCSQGKDRTGIGAALILGALGASREAIVQDFDRSNDSYRPLVEKLCADVEAAGGGDEEKEVVRAFMGVSVKNFCHGLDVLEANWDSIPGYLEEQMGIDQEDLQKLRNRYLEPLDL